MLTSNSFMSPTGLFAASTPLSVPVVTQRSQDGGTASEPSQEQQARDTQSDYSFAEPSVPQK